MIRAGERVAVVGGGTLGLYVAAALSDRNSVLVIEPAAGSASSSTEAILGEIANPGGHDGLTTAWTSAWGGTSNLWGGQLMPWQAWEFDGTVGETWPIEASRMPAYYERVRRNLGLSAVHTELHGVSQRVPELKNEDLTVHYSTWMTKSQRNFARNKAIQRGLRSVQRAIGWRVDKVSGRGPYTLIATTNGGRSQQFTADKVVLAAGVLGNSRILSTSFPDLPNVGSGFMDHISRRYARFHVYDWSTFLSFAGQRYRRGVRASPKIIPSASLLNREQLNPGYGHWEFALGDAQLLNSDFETKSLSNLRQIGKEVGQAAHGATDILRRRRPVPRFARVFLRVDVEQRKAPMRRIHWAHQGSDSRMTLQWDISSRENDTSLRLGGLIANAIADAKVGAVPSCDGLCDFIDTKHLMGGATMGLDSSSSVTTPHGRVHGTSNIWVVGASVFPTGGIANPTFTALALAERTVETINE